MFSLTISYFSLIFDAMKSLFCYFNKVNRIAKTDFAGYRLSVDTVFWFLFCGDGPTQGARQTKRKSPCWPLKAKRHPFIKEVPFGLNIKPIELNQIHIFECEGQSHSHKSHYFTCLLKLLQ